MKLTQSSTVLNLRFTAKQCLLFVLIIFAEINSGLAQSGTELPSNVQQRSDGNVDFIPRLSEEVTVNEKAPNRIRREDPSPIGNEGLSNQTQQTCQKLSHCEPDEIRTAYVCILGRVGSFSDCPDSSSTPLIVDLRYRIRSSSSPKLILDKLDNVADRCLKIAKLYFITRGYSGYMGIGLNNSNVNELKPYSCLMRERDYYSSVTILGSPIGKGCSGRFFMQQMAENLFSGRDHLGHVVASLGNNTGMELRYFPSNADGSKKESTWVHRQRINRGIEGNRNNDVDRRNLQKFCQDDIQRQIRNIRNRQFELTDLKGRECPKLNQCRRTPYNDVIRNARSIIEAPNMSLSEASRHSDQLSSIENVLSQCTFSTPHTGCSLSDFLNIKRRGRGLGITISNRVRSTSQEGTR